jgi:hypothetical protein
MPHPNPSPKLEGQNRLINEVKISIRKIINMFFRKFICNSGIAPPTWGRGWGGAIAGAVKQS